jgi:hypothetical protein
LEKRFPLFRIMRQTASQETWPEAEPKAMTNPFGESRGGTPTGERIRKGAGRADRAADMDQRLSAFRFLSFFLA